MEIVETATRRKAVFTRDEILVALGVDLADFFYASLSSGSETLVLHYMPGKQS
jgi:hypothetical protein